VSPGKARWLITPKVLTLTLLLAVLFDPVSAIQKSEPVKGTLLALVDTSSSMDVADDYRQPRTARARQIVQRWQRALPAEIRLEELEFDTTIHKPGPPPGPAMRGTDLAGCLLALSERADLASYLGVVLLTDGGDEQIETTALPKAPLYIVGTGTDPSTWNDLAITDAQCPPEAEKDVDFEITADLRARAGHGLGFAEKAAHARVLLERATGSGSSEKALERGAGILPAPPSPATGGNAWEKVLEQPLDLSNLRARARLPVKCAQTGLQHYRLTALPLAGELSSLNNSRLLTVNVQKKSLRVLYFTRELGQEFKMLRNELGRDPGISFTALFRTSGDRFTLQGDRRAGDDPLSAGLPSTKQGLEAYDAIIIGSFPAEDCAPRQMQALIQFVENGGALIFLGGEESFGRGGYAQTSLATLFPWRLSDREPEPAHESVGVHVPPMGAGHPILATVEDILARSSATLDAVNLVSELKPGATALLDARLGARELAIVAIQPFGKGKVLAIASNTLWKWATQPEPLRSAYGLFWRQAIRNLTGKTEGGQNLSVRFDKDFYRPGEQAAVEIRAPGARADALRFTASLAISDQAAPVRPPERGAGILPAASPAGRDQAAPVSVEPLPGQNQAWQAKLRFRQRGEYMFRLVAYQGERVLETFEKNLAIAPLLSEGSRLELDEPFLQQLAQRGGGAYFREADADQLLQRIGGRHARRAILQESSLVEAGPWLLLALLALLVAEWMLRRKMGLF
jgi:uncharacterized membrane protein